MDTPEGLPLSPQEVLDEVRSAMAQLGHCSEHVDPTAHLVDDLALDSLDWVDLALQLEESLCVSLREQRFASVRTVQNIVDHVLAARTEENRTPK